MERVLVIDDDNLVRDSLTLTLEWAGYDVSEAANTQEGLSFHRENPATVVVANEINSNEDRLEQIRAFHNHSPTVPIIAISGTVPSSDQEIDRLNSISTSLVHLQKPFTVDELLTTIQTALPH